MSMPYAFSKAGVLLSMGLLAIMMFFSYMTCTYVLEALATASRIKRRQAADSENVAAGAPDPTQEIEERVEMGALGQMLLPARYGKLTYIVLCVYAYGVLCVYVIAGCESLSKEIGPIGGVDSYRPLVALFALFVTPVCLLDFSKTRPLQLTVGFLRIMAVFLMYLIMSRYLNDLDRASVTKMFHDIPLFKPSGLPSVFGNTAFTFMIHHSIPGLIYPLYNQQSSAKTVRSVYVTAYTLYALQGFLALWAFGDATWADCENWPSHPCEIQGLFNTNFSSADLQWAAKFIVLYPVTVVSVFPLVSITLRNNLKAACGAAQTVGLDRQNLLFTALTVCPPYIVAFFTKNVQIVLKYVGCYFGLSLMFLVPSLMVVNARGHGFADGLALRSRFGSKAAVISVIVLFTASVLFSTVTFIMGK